jgi:hypothetical protein
MMSHSRWTVSLLVLAIFFANACCLAHIPPKTVAAAKPVHPCCQHKTAKSDSTPQPSKECDCCQRVDQNVTQASTSDHAPLTLFAIAWIAAEPTCLAHTPICSLHFDAQAPPGANDVLQLSCTLIL